MQNDVLFFENLFSQLVIFSKTPKFISRSHTCTHTSRVNLLQVASCDGEVLYRDMESGTVLARFSSLSSSTSRGRHHQHRGGGSGVLGGDSDSLDTMASSPSSAAVASSFTCIDASEDRLSVSTLIAGTDRAGVRCARGVLSCAVLWCQVWFSGLCWAGLGCAELGSAMFCLRVLCVCFFFRKSFGASWRFEVNRL